MSDDLEGKPHLRCTDCGALAYSLNDVVEHAIATSVEGHSGTWKLDIHQEDL